MLAKKFFNSRALLLLTLIHLCFPISSVASVDDERKRATEAAIEMELWNAVEWLNLMHYQKEWNNYTSQVDDKRFFYADDGDSNPRAELLETIKQLFSPTENPDQQAQCRFVARSEWLTTQLEIDKTVLPVVDCAEYKEWRGLTKADQVTMIFPAYHLNSPSSMFGHTLLRLDDSSNEKSEWLSYAVNFGADIDNDDNSLIYAYRGLAGGYPGIFITEPYFKKIQEYNRIEHRDIWEYRLNLTADETETMIKHLWELKTINFDYYFFDENCSYRLLELLEVARPEIELTDEFVITAIPVDTVRSIKQAGLIESVKYRPALATEIQFALKDMPEAQQVLVLGLSDDFDVSTSEAFTALDQRQQKIIVDLAYRYLRYQNTKKSRDPAIAKRSFQLLQLLNRYDPSLDIDVTVTTPFPPEKGHKSKRLTLGGGRRLDTNYAELGFKMAFHDLEDAAQGFLQGAQINIGSMKLRLEDDSGIRLHQLDLVDIFSLTPRNRFFTPLSWRVYSGFERQFTNHKDQLTYHVTGGVGSSWQLIKDHQLYALGTLRLEINKQLKNTFEPAIGFNTGLLSHFGWTSARLEFSGEQFEDGIYRLRTQYTQNIVIETNHSIKLDARYQWQNDNTEFSDINLNYQYYF